MAKLDPAIVVLGEYQIATLVIGEAMDLDKCVIRRGPRKLLHDPAASIVLILDHPPERIGATQQFA